MGRRTEKEIEEDFRKIKVTVEIKENICSLKEVAELTELSESAVRTSLHRHPKVEDKIMQTLEERKKHVPSAKKEHVKKSESSQNKLARHKMPEWQKDRAEASLKKLKEREKIMKKETLSVIVDSTIAPIDAIGRKLLRIIDHGSKITLTTITIKELDSMRMGRDAFGKGARAILELSEEYPTSFETVPVERGYNTTTEEAIVRYCAQRKSSRVLMTLSREMVNRAEECGVATVPFSIIQK